MLHDVTTTPCSAEEPAKDSNPFNLLLGGGKKAAKEADKSSKQGITLPTEHWQYCLDLCLAVRRNMDVTL